MRIKRFFGAAGIAGQPSGSNQPVPLFACCRADRACQKEKAAFCFPQNAAFPFSYQGAYPSPQKPPGLLMRKFAKALP